MIEKKKVLALFIVLIITALLFIGLLVCCLNFNAFIPEADENDVTLETVFLLTGLTLILGGILLIPVMAIYLGCAALFIVYAILIICAKSPDTLATYCKVLIIILAIALLGLIVTQIIFIEVTFAAAMPLALAILALIGYVATLILAITTRKYANNL